MNRFQRKNVDKRLEWWGEQTGHSYNSGWASKSPLVEIIEYSTRITKRREQMLPVHETNPNVKKTNDFLKTVGDELFQVAYLEWAWHNEYHTEETDKRGKVKDRRKLKPKQIWGMMGIGRTKFYDLRGKLYQIIWDALGPLRG